MSFHLLQHDRAGFSLVLYRLRLESVQRSSAAHFTEAEVAVHAWMLAMRANCASWKLRPVGPVEKNSAFKPLLCSGILMGKSVRWLAGPGTPGAQSCLTGRPMALEVILATNFT
jgi:hypothetical protein